MDESIKMLAGITDDFEINTFISKCRERYSDVGISENKLYPGIKETINELSNKEIPMAICTSRRQEFAESNFLTICRF